MLFARTTGEPLDAEVEESIRRLQNLGSSYASIATFLKAIAKEDAVPEVPAVECESDLSDLQSIRNLALGRHISLERLSKERKAAKSTQGYTEFTPAIVESLLQAVVKARTEGNILDEKSRVLLERMKWENAPLGNFAQLIEGAASISAGDESLLCKGLPEHITTLLGSLPPLLSSNTNEPGKSGNIPTLDLNGIIEAALSLRKNGGTFLDEDKKSLAKLNELFEIGSTLTQFIVELAEADDVPEVPDNVPLEVALFLEEVRDVAKGRGSQIRFLVSRR